MQSKVSAHASLHAPVWCWITQDLKGVRRDYEIGDRWDLQAKQLSLMSVRICGSMALCRVEALYPGTWEWQTGIVRLAGCPETHAAQCSSHVGTLAATESWLFIDA